MDRDRGGADSRFHRRLDLLGNVVGLAQIVFGFDEVKRRPLYLVGDSTGDSELSVTRQLRGEHEP